MISENLFFKRGLIIHPINIILLFFINTGSQKFKAGLPIGFLEPAVSFLIIFSLSLAIFLFINRFIKDSFKSSSILSYILLVTLFFRDIVEFIIFFGIPGALNFIGEMLIVIITAIILLVVFARWLVRTKRSILSLNSYLNLLTTIFLIIEVAGCSMANISKIELKEEIELKSSVNNPNTKPDIYFILLDGYTGFSGLKKLWKFDNGELKKFLDKNNFFFAQNGRSVYNVTNYSLASTFNMTELIYDTSNLYGKGSFLTLANLIKHNPVVEYLNKSGYDLINFSFWDIYDRNKFYQDIYFLRGGNIYQSRTIYGHLYEIWNERFADMAEINSGIFNSLEKLPGTFDEIPKFVYAHIMMPHPPYYFDAEGNRTDFIYSNDGKNMHKYLEQLKYTNKLLMKTITGILNSSKQPPIIIVQSDHGFRSYEGNDKLEIEHSTLSCFYFPDQDYSILNDSLKSVNTFRIIFNKYFNQNLKLIN